MRIYGRNAVAEAQRGHRRVLRVWSVEDTTRDELDRLAGSPDHQGIVAEVEPFPYTPVSELLAPEDAVLVALDEVQDPQNLGAVCRSAEFLGAAGVVVCERRAVHVTPAVCRASAGAVEHIPIAIVRNLADWLGDAKAAGAWVYGADSGGSARPSDVPAEGRVVLVLGAEGRGLRPRVSECCDAVVAIPRQGRLDSLNVSNAAAVLLYEAMRRRQR